MSFKQLRLSRSIILRICADVILINISLLIAITLKLIAVIFMSSNSILGLSVYTSGEEAIRLEVMWETYTDFSIPLTITCIIIFFLNGFYTHGRTYRSRFKALLIFQGVTLSYLIIAFLNYMFYSNEIFSRGVWLIGWGTTFIMVGGARLWSALWNTIVSFESKRSTTSKFDKIRNVLVIGGAGYLGSVLVRKLLRNNYNVKILDMLMYGDSSIRELYSYEKRFHVIHGDFRSVDLIVKAMDGVDAVIHLGAIVGDPACQIDQEMTFDINLMSTKMIAEVAKGFGVRRFIFASTCSVYGANEEILTEKSELNPQSLYAETKIASEKVLQSLGQNGFLPIILRLATLFGMSYRPRFDLVINLLAAKAVCEGEISIFGGEQWRPFIHVSDAAEAFMKFLELPFYPDSLKIFNVGSNSNNYQLSQIGDIIKNIRPSTNVLQLAEKSDPRNYRVSFNRIQNALNFETRYDIESGVVEMIDAFEHSLINDYRDAKYNNYKFLSEDHCYTRFKFDLVPKSLFVESPLPSDKLLDMKQLPSNI